ncbi:MAG: hypothetical protein ACHREM_02440 [Polyangiales bacterium]
MAFLVFLGIFWLISYGVFAAGRGAAKDVAARTRVFNTGVPASGLILSASKFSTRLAFNGQVFDTRAVVLDVEVPGAAPYEVSVTPLIPRFCEVLPGASLELRVDPTDPKNLLVVGPAGSSAWIGAAPWLAVQQPLGTAPAPTSSRPGCGTIFFVAVSASLLFGAYNAFTNPSVATASKHPVCDQATRCCKTLGRNTCKSFASMSESECKTSLKDLKKSAAKVQKVCE